MKIPVVRGIIDRRILVNFRVDPRVLRKILPAPFQPQMVGGFGMAGICLIRLRELRPWFLPAIVGLTSENAAHRIAVEWRDGGAPRRGVYVPRRDTSSRLNHLAGGRLFPGFHHHARFEVEETEARVAVRLRSDDGETRVAIAAKVSRAPPPTSCFHSLEEASRFFEAGSQGYSATRKPGLYDGLELRAFNWRIEPLQVEAVESSFFDDRGAFPEGSIAFDSAFIMRNIAHEWRGLPALSSFNPTLAPQFSAAGTSDKGISA